ncbi:Glycosyltransferase involved in cell wall bisynthesis [Cruoricaptor ignavus]|uniref:Glycosyltransferase involved in cell wall bisynthesis n=1 Tax=Cruoricaptor ignavus TaxID=1118202 RepID=A0A1M6DW35_9FLAO|nr:glycosyltransferase [Cruoricaptor ignavus]SHI77330.1 Glycosyltransferase involved in cell wall bisynthesis [Cruoricaptor ignavus]
MGNVKNILLLSTQDNNGAYLYVVKLAEVLIEMGHNVRILVKIKTQNLPFITQYLPPKRKRETLYDKALWRIREKIMPSQPLEIIDGKYAFISYNELKENEPAEELLRQTGFTPDYIFTGMTRNFLNSTDIRNLQLLTEAKVFTLMVDMNHLTGGCHFAWDCDGYIKGCPAYCPAIGNNPRAMMNHQRKYENATQGNWECIAASSWTQTQLEQSKIYRNQKNKYNFNSIIDTRIFNSDNKNIAKRIFGLDDDTFYILCGAQGANERKGFDYMKEAMNIFAQKQSQRRASLLLVSNGTNPAFDSVNIRKHFVPYIKDYRLLSLLYQSVDVFVNSSIEDSGPMMVSEALACGTPVIGFDMGIVNNMVITGYNGYRAELRNSADLAKGIEEIYSLTPEEYAQYSANAVKQVEEFSSHNYVKSELEKILV